MYKKFIKYSLNIIIVVFIFISGLFFGLYLMKSGKMKFIEKNLLFILENGSQWISNYNNSNSSKLQKIGLFIKKKDLELLSTQRSQAHTWRNFLFYYPLVTWSDSVKRKKVEGKLITLSDTFLVKTRLTGLFYDHFREANYRWSYRIKTKKGKLVNGMKEFNLMLPLTREYLIDFLGHELMKYFKMNTLKSELVHLELNNKVLGIYLMEEYYEKELVNFKDSSQGIIIRINPNFKLDINHRIFKDSCSVIEYTRLQERLDLFSTKDGDAKSIFDFEKFSLRLAISALFNESHSLLNFNFYCFQHADHKLLIPLGREWKLNKYETENDFKKYLLNIKNTNPIYNKLIEDKRFVLMLKDDLIKISNSDNLKAFFESRNNLFNQMSKSLHTEYPFVRLKKKEIYHNSKIISEFCKSADFLNYFNLHTTL